MLGIKLVIYRELNVYISSKKMQHYTRHREEIKDTCQE